MYKIDYVRSVLKESEPFLACDAAQVVKFVEQYCQPKEQQWKEMAWVLTVNRANKVQGYHKLSEGNVHATGFDKKEIAKVAIDDMATGVILVHNHPSGNCLPSQADIAATDSVRKALRLFDIDLLDHVVIGTDEHFSFAIEEKVKD